MKTGQLALIGTVLALFSLLVVFVINETFPKTEFPETANFELIDELVKLGCTEAAINHAYRYTNALDDPFDGSFIMIEWVSLPKDLTEDELHNCIKIIVEKRTLDRSDDVLKSKTHTSVPKIGQNDMFCWTQWYMQNTIINEEELISSLRHEISMFGSDFDIPNREITISHHEEETIISIGGSWTEDKPHHEKLTFVIKNYIGDSELIRDDIVLCA